MAPLPLSQFRILDFGTAWAGGMAGRMLADFGAEVIKVESWKHLDGSRMGRPILVDDIAGGDEGKWPDMQPGFHVMGRNKKSIAVDLRSDGAAEVVRRLVEVSDAVIHNFSPGVMDRLGLDYSTLCAANPRIVLVGQSIAGSEGPLRDYIGYAGTVASLSGMARLVGYEGSEPGGMSGGLYSDIVSALTTVFATLAGLYEVNLAGDNEAKSGRGWDLSQWEATMALAGELVFAYSITGEELEPRGFRHELCCPYGNYPSSGDDQWVSIAVGTDEEWGGLCRVMPELMLANDERFRTPAGRQTHRLEIDAQVASWTQQRTAEEATVELQSAGVAAFPVQNIENIYFDDHNRSRETFVEIEHPLIGIEPLPGIPWKLSATPGEVRTPAPLLGQDNLQVFTQILGMSADEYGALVAHGVIEERPENTP